MSRWKYWALVAWAAFNGLSFFAAAVLAVIAEHQDHYAEAVWHLLLAALFYWNVVRAAKQESNG